MPNRPDSLVGTIGVRVTANTGQATRALSRLEQKAREANQELDKLGAHRLGAVSSGSGASFTDADRQQFQAIASSVARTNQLLDNQLLVQRSIASAMGRTTRATQRQGRAVRQNTGYIQRQLKALRDFSIRYATIVGGFGAVGGGIALLSESISGGEELLVTQQRLEALVGSAEAFNSAWASVLAVTNRTRTPFAQNLDLFESLYLQMEDLPFATLQSAEALEGISLLFRAGADDADAMRRSIVQLRQIFQKGFASTQDTRIIREQSRAFDDFQKASGLGDRFTSQELVAALTSGPGRNLIQTRGLAADTRLSVQATRVAEAFQLASASALKQTGFLDAVNEGVKEFEDLLRRPEFQQWLQSFYFQMSQVVNILRDMGPELLRVVQVAADIALAFLDFGVGIVRVIDNMGGLADVFVSLSVAAAAAAATLVTLGAIGQGRALLQTFTAGAGGFGVGALAAGHPILAAALAAIAVGGLAYTYFSSRSSSGDRQQFQSLPVDVEGRMAYAEIENHFKRVALEKNKDVIATLRLTDAYRRLRQEQEQVATTDAFPTDIVASVQKRIDDLEAYRSSFDLTAEERQIIGFITAAPNTEEIFAASRDQSVLRDYRFRDALRGTGRFFDSGDELIASVGSRRPLEEWREFLQRVLPFIRAGGTIDQLEGVIDQIGRDAERVLNLRGARVIPEVPTSAFDAVADLFTQYSGALRTLVDRGRQSQLDQLLEQAKIEVKTLGDVEVFARQVAEFQSETRRRGIERGLEDQIRAEEIRSKGQETEALKAARVRLQVFRGQIDVEGELAKARDERVRLLKESYLPGTLGEAAKEIQRQLEENQEVITFYENILGWLQELGVLTDKISKEEEQVALNIGKVALKSKLDEQAKRQNDLYKNVIDLQEVFERRRVGLEQRNRGAAFDLVSLSGLGPEDRARAENMFYLTDRLAESRRNLAKAFRDQDQDAITLWRENIHNLEGAIVDLNAGMDENLTRWEEARVAQLSLQEVMKQHARELENIDRFSRAVAQSFRDGFLSVIDGAQNVEEALHGITRTLRNLLFDLVIIEPFERGIRGVLTDNAVDRLDISSILKKIRGFTLGNVVLPSSDRTGGTGEVREVRNTTVNNYMPPDVAVRYQRETSLTAVRQARQIEANNRRRRGAA